MEGDGEDFLNDSIARLRAGSPQVKFDNTIRGARDALRRMPGVEHFHYDLMSYQKRIAHQVPWLHGSSNHFPRSVTDQDFVDASVALEELGFGKFSKHNVADAISSICYDRTINPIVDYLKGLSWDTTPRLQELGFTMFGVTNALQKKYVRRWMVAAVERAMRPGTVAGAVLTLVGTQGYGKTSFLNVLFNINGRSYHDESLPDPSGFQGATPAKRHIQPFWCISAGEFSSMKRSELSAMKLFLTEVEDSFDEKYQQELSRRPRRCVFAGTSNERQVLVDPTGNRRFWMLDVAHPVPLAWLAENRDQIWAETYHAWSQGELPNIDPSDYEASAQIAEDFTDLPDWVADLENYLEDEGNPLYAPCSDVYASVFGADFEPSKDWLRAKQLNSQLAARGYYKKMQRVGGKRTMVFTREVGIK